MQADPDHTGRRRLDAPDIAGWRDGGAGIPYAVRRAGVAAGPEVVVTALIHGNEVCGAHALAHWLTHAPDPRRGAVTAVFCNHRAYRTSAAGRPAPSRCIDEDLNRVWSADVLAGPRESAELRRARQLRPLIDGCDLLLDLHSMQSPGPPLALAGMLEKGRELAHAVGVPEVVVCDAGHAAGVRLRDYGAFADPASPKNALLVECGQHTDPASAAVATEALYRFLLAAGVVDGADVAPFLAERPMPRPQRFVEVTEAVTPATDDFAFLRPLAALEVVPEPGTPIARDGTREIVTPYPNCFMVMPARRAARGQTAVRLGRELPAAGSETA